MNSKSDLLRKHIIAPAIQLGDGSQRVVRGQVGQTHDEIGGHTTPDSERGFIMSDGKYLQRDQARARLNGQSGELFKSGEPTSEQLRVSVPIYESPRQRIYSLGGNKAVSLVEHPDGITAAALWLFDPNRGPSAGFSIDYHTELPADNLTEEEAIKYLHSAASMPLESNDGQDLHSIKPKVS